MKANRNSVLHSKNNLNWLRQQLKNRLIKIGMVVEGQRDSSPKMCRRSRGKTQEDQMLPSLQSYRNKQFNNEIKQVFEINYQKMLKQRTNKRELSKQIIRGLKYEKSSDSSRHVSPTELKDAIHKKLVQSTKADRLTHKLPAMMIKNGNKERQMSQTIRIMRLDKPSNTEIIEKFGKRQKAHRYKTQEKQSILSRNHRRSKNTKELTPWEMDFARETNIDFN